MLEGLETSKRLLEERFLSGYAPRRQESQSGPSVVHGTSLEAYTDDMFLGRYRNHIAVPANNELMQYLQRKPAGSCNPVEWWAGHQDSYPNLSRMARDILSMPGEYFIRLGPLSVLTDHLHPCNRLCCLGRENLLRREGHDLVPTSMLEAGNSPSPNDCEACAPTETRANEVN